MSEPIAIVVIVALVVLIVLLGRSFLRVFAHLCFFVTLVAIAFTYDKLCDWWASRHRQKEEADRWNARETLPAAFGRSNRFLVAIR